MNIALALKSSPWLAAIMGNQTFSKTHVDFIVYVRTYDIFVGIRMTSLLVFGRRLPSQVWLAANLRFRKISIVHTVVDLLLLQQGRN